MSTPIADMVEHLISTGIPPEAIIAAVRAAEQHAQSLGGVDPVAAKRRAYDRERKRAKPAGNSTGVPAVPLSSSTSLPSEDVIEKKEIKKERARGKNGCVCPDGWAPHDGHYREAAQDMGRDRDAVDRLVDEMRNWSKENAHRAIARKSDWSIAFTRWMRREWGKSNGGRNGHRNGFDRTNPTAGHRETGTDAIIAGVVAASERRARERGQGKLSPRGETTGLLDLEPAGAGCG